MIGELNPEIDIIAVYETIEETADHLLNHGQPDILFVDIHVADGNSFYDVGARPSTVQTLKSTLSY